VRPYNRFGAQKIADTGKDPLGSFAAFLKNDPYKNIDIARDRHEATKHETSIKIPQGQVPYGTTVCTYRLGLNNNAKLDREGLGIETKTFPRNTTDNLSFEPPAANRPFQAVYDGIVTRPKYNKNVCNNHPWEPHPVTVNSINNRSGGTHDIISHLPMKYQAGGSLGILDKQLTNKRKGVTEFGDLQRPSSLNPNLDLLKALNDDPYVFRRKNGLFTNLYDSAARFGETKVFKA
jgi:hypothetical protein